MININSVKRGFSAFVEQEVCPSMKGLQKFAVATGAGIIASKMEAVLKSLPFGLADGDEIDIECIYSEAMKHISGTIPVEIPMIGTLNFTADNLRTLYEFILNS